MINKSQTLSFVDNLLPRLTLIIAFLFVVLTVSSSLTHRPQIDEGLFASPAWNLAAHGFLGTTILETENSPLIRIDERTYWVQPLFLLNAAASFKIFGFGLFSLRLVSVFWGVIMLLSWYAIMLNLAANRRAALLCLILLACDYVVLDNAASGRMDMMSAALGFAAFAAYFSLREKNLLLAVLASQSLVVASGLTHPNGIMPFFGLIFLTLYFDRSAINWRHIAVALIPYAIGGAGFGFWVWQDPAAFRAQFIDNALMGGRTNGLSSPLTGFIREFTERYPQAFGLGKNSGGHSGPVYLKSLILLGYLTGVLGTLLTKSLRQNTSVRALLILTTINFVVLSLIDGQKETPYLIHIVPYYLALLAFFAVWIWKNRLISAQLVTIGLLIFISLGVGGMALRIRQNTRAKIYQAAIDYLKQNATNDDEIMGGAELGFGLNFPPNLVSDGRFGYYTGKRPKFIVFDDAAQSSWESARTLAPQLYEYIPRLLSEEYQLVYENPGYKIYVRR